MKSFKVLGFTSNGADVKKIVINAKTMKDAAWEGARSGMQLRSIAVTSEKSAFRHFNLNN